MGQIRDIPENPGRVATLVNHNVPVSKLMELRLPAVIVEELTTPTPFLDFVDTPLARTGFQVFWAEI